MKPILKWTGGKSSELNIIKENLPSKINSFVEPFLGGGAVYFNLENKVNFVNDFNKELILFYKIIQDKEKLTYLSKIIQQMDVERNEIKNIKNINQFHEKSKNISNNEKYQYYLNREYNSKIKSINKINNKNLNENKQLLSEDEKFVQIITSCYAALYYMYRDMYNDKNQNNIFDIEHIAYWFLMREIAYSGMFRYSKNGKFNVPYGGISYNSKNLMNKLNYINEVSNQDFFKQTVFNNGDFEDFFKKYNYFENDDFIFVDPPYDSNFSQYNKEEDFDKTHQIRLRDTLLKTKANIMIVIKYTDFIYDLYKDDFNITSFDKNYSVNFKNRNDREVNHIIIKNY